jgi:hypothetical protein
MDPDRIGGGFEIEGRSRSWFAPTVQRQCCSPTGPVFWHSNLKMLGNAVTLSSLWLSIASFVSFLVFATLSYFQKPSKTNSQPKDVQLQAGVSDITKLVEAVAKLAESFGKFAGSLAKAGPAISALVASLIFMAIALAAGGK